MKNILLLSFLLVSVSCSFKSNDGGGGTPSVSALELSASELDSDGDGIPNTNELESGTDPFVADVPVFKGEMMEEINIHANYYSRSEDKFEKGEMLVKSDDNESVFKKGSSLIRYVSEDTSAFAERSTNNIVTNISFNDINVYTAPIISDEVAHNFMSQISAMEENGYLLDEVEFEVRNKIRLESTYLKNFRDIVFEAYFYDYQSKKLEFIDYYENKGSFEFNKEHLLDIPSIKTRNTRILNNSVLKTGRFLYIKLKDFYIPELRKNYSDLMKEVRKKTVPLVINEPNNFQVKFVGTNGSPDSFVNIINKGLKDDFEIDNNTFIKYKSYPVGEYRHDTSNGERINIFSKWHVITNEIPNNPFSYSFLGNDVIVLNYSKSTDPVFLARDVVNTFIDTAKMKSLKGEPIYPAKTRKMKIILSSLFVKEPVIVESFSSRSGWGNGTCGPAKNHTGTVVYKHTALKFNDVPVLMNDSRFNEILKYTIVEIDGFEYSLSKLIEEKKFSLQIDENNKVILESQDSFLKSLKGFGVDPVKFSIIHRRQFSNIETGTYIHDCKCTQVSGPGYNEIGCRDVQDRGSVQQNSTPKDYTFYTSVFIF